MHLVDVLTQVCVFLFALRTFMLKIEIVEILHSIISIITELQTVYGWAGVLAKKDMDLDFNVQLL